MLDSLQAYAVHSLVWLKELISRRSERFQLTQQTDYLDFSLFSFV